MTTAIVPASPAELEVLPSAEQELAVTGFLNNARSALVAALAATSPATSVAHLKAEIASIQTVTRQFNLSKDVRDDAQEMVRRAEWALGKAIRAGQEAGEIRKQGERRGGAAVHVDNKNSRKAIARIYGAHPTTVSRTVRGIQRKAVA